jgi:hypothetical protein
MRGLTSHNSLRLFSLLCPALAVSLGALAAWAQQPVGTISGTVYDQAGAVVTGAAVTVRGKATGLERKLTRGRSPPPRCRRASTKSSRRRRASARSRTR